MISSCDFFFEHTFNFRKCLILGFEFSLFNIFFALREKLEYANSISHAFIALRILENRPGFAILRNEYGPMCFIDLL